jgi:hypothetical protein
MDLNSAKTRPLIFVRLKSGIIGQEFKIKKRTFVASNSTRNDHPVSVRAYKLGRSSVHQ